MTFYELNSAARSLVDNYGLADWWINVSAELWSRPTPRHKDELLFRIFISAYNRDLHRSTNKVATPQIALAALDNLLRDHLNIHDPAEVEAVGEIDPAEASTNGS